jgi:2-polyprenyl-3-methyl-5-hydroxy-6-metoxy-1,4-benzoquinol methylase
MNPQDFLSPVVSHGDLVAAVLADVGSVPVAPTHGRYLSKEEADAIVAATIHHSRRNDSAQEYEYLNGHRNRLAASLTMIPKAESAEACCLDIGCYGYMAFWAWRYLGYAKVEGIEMRLGEPAEIVREVEMDGERLSLPVHNFDISKAEWPLDGTFDTLLFFETLEHVTHDPSGVMLNVTRRMTPASTLVISVPNAVSHKTLQEFMAGAPPWTYWFFEPDLTHEPRHSFEYTPIFFKILLRSAGLKELAFRTMTAYAQPDTVKDYFDIGRALSIEPCMFGETMIAQARKVSEEPLFRYPDCIYDAGRYYESTYPLLRPGLDAARDAFLARTRIEEAQLREANERASEAIRAEHEANERASEAVRAEREALFLCDIYRTKLDAAELVQRAAEERVHEAELVQRAAEERAHEAELSQRAAEERAHEHAIRYEQIVHSSSWRVTGPLRRALDSFTTLRSSMRALGRDLCRAGRRPLRDGH